MSENKSIASLILAILSFVVPVLGLVLAIIAVVLAHQVRSKDKESKLALAGLIIGYVNIAMVVLVALLFALGMAAFLTFLIPFAL